MTDNEVVEQIQEEANVTSRIAIEAVSLAGVSLLGQIMGLLYGAGGLSLAAIDREDDEAKANTLQSFLYWHSQQITEAIRDHRKSNTEGEATLSEDGTEQASDNQTDPPSD